MIEDIRNTKTEIESKLKSIENSEQLEEFRLEYLIKKGKIQAFFGKMRELSNEEKREVGKELNIVSKFAESEYKRIKQELEEKAITSSSIDLTLPGNKQFVGSEHPVRQTISQMIDIFTKMGFSVAEGPEAEDDYHNFDALNFPPNHPARDMQDTFFLDNKHQTTVLRTHTSPVQIRMMENIEPPIRAIMPGRVYRNETLDSTHLAEFHQIEGLYIDKNVTMAELKATMMHFARVMYGDDIEFRFRASFFPFTEPSAELDIRTKHSNKWMEIVGCGMVHPNVLKAGGVDPEVYTGYAFGFGVERITMAKTQLDDIRKLYENDVRVLKQF
ncbi:MAG: phenylalanine--tRNA ligase subunit alpha [Chlorobiota bacterium]